MSASGTDRHDIAICGAGIAGLTFAIVMAGAGRHPVVFEARQQAAIANEGVFITLAPNGVNGLCATGCLDQVRADGIDTLGIELRNHAGRRLDFGDQSDYEQVFGAPSITIRRGRLAGILLARARELGVDIRLGTRIAGVAATSDTVRLQLSDGTAQEAAILVAADGLRSGVRAMVFPEYPAPRFTGLIGTGGITKADVPDTGGVMRMTFGTGSFFGYLKAAGHPVYWFNSYPEDAADIDAQPDPVRLANHVRALHANDPAPVAEILAHVTELDRFYPIHDMPALPGWHRWRAVLIGDAAHAVAPHAGQGASMAIEDALVLAACLMAEQGHEAAFCRYETLRRARVARVARLAARNGSRKGATGRLGLLMRDLILPLRHSAGSAQRKESVHVPRGLYAALAALRPRQA